MTFNNLYLKESINLANNFNYLDRLYEVYPMASNVRRNINNEYISQLKQFYDSRNNIELLAMSMTLDLFPVKDSYVAFLKSCQNAICNNPETVNRIAGMMYELGWGKFMENITEPKETNRQMGALFKNWLFYKNPLGVPLIEDEKKFFNSNLNAVLFLSDAECGKIAREKFGYSRDKGLDFFARFNGKYVVGEAKFLTAYGGHQNAQLEDAVSTLEANIQGAEIIAILDGVCYIKGDNKMFNMVNEKGQSHAIMSSLLLRDFLYQI